MADSSTRPLDRTASVWVEPFAVPILAERAEVVIRARQMTLSKARLGESAQPLGAAVRWNLAGKGLGLPEDTFDAAWTAWNVTNGLPRSAAAQTQRWQTPTTRQPCQVAKVQRFA